LSIFYQIFGFKSGAHDSIPWYEPTIGDSASSWLNLNILVGGARIAQLIRSLIVQSIDRGFEPHCQRGGFSGESLASPSLQIASVGSGHHGKKTEVDPNQ